MGTTELSVARGRAAGEWLVLLGALCATTTLAAVTVWLVAPLQAPVRRLLGLRLAPASTPEPSVGHVLALVAHNLPVVSWPLLLSATGVAGSARAARLGNLLVGGSLTVNAVLVGAAFGAYGLRLAAFVPQLPLEWAALALGASCWLRRQTGRELAAATGLLVVLVTAAAALETFAVPHAAAIRGVGRPGSARLESANENGSVAPRPQEDRHGRRQDQQHTPNR